MIERFKKIFENKDKRTENLISLLIILIITLIVINKIIEGSDVKEKDYENQIGVELAQNSEIIVQNEINDLSEKLENILCKINGVGEVAVLITYSESSKIVPIYNINESESIVEEKDSGTVTKKTENNNNQKTVITDSNSNIITEKNIYPSIEGAIITAQGASNSVIKNNIVSAVEAVTGLPTHKIQVFEMGG